jgi:hypothetical protein
MRYFKLTIFFCIILILTVSVFAQTEKKFYEPFGKPGITPDNAFYFLDTMFDGFQSPENVANEKAAEIVAMAQENKINALEKARQRYDIAMEKRNRLAETEQEKEQVAKQSFYHLQVLAQLLEEVPEQAKPGIENAMYNSAKSLNKSLNNLSELNPEKANKVKEEVLSEISENTPEQTKNNINKSLNSAGISAENNFRLMVSDAPADIEDFQYLIVEFSKIRIFKESENGNEDEKDFEERNITVSVDLTQVIGEKSSEILSTNLVPGIYSKIELYVESIEAKANDEIAEVTIPGEKLQIVKPFEITENSQTVFIFDIEVVKKGPTNTYNLFPLISKSGGVVVPQGGDCESGKTRMCFSAHMAFIGIGECASGIQTCVNGHWNLDCVGEVLPTAEICNSLDDDCDSSIDEGLDC